MHHPTVIRSRTRAQRAGRSVSDVGAGAIFVVRSVAAIPSAMTRYGKEVLRLISEIGFGSGSILAGGGSVGVIVAIAFFVGTQTGLEGYRGLELVGLAPLSGALSAVANTREVAPIIAAITLAAKVGTGFTAQLGAMRISEEISALEVMGIESRRYLVSTRMAAAIAAIIPLYLVGLFGAFVSTAVAVQFVNGQSSGTYDYYFSLFIAPGDVALSIVKTVVFALGVTAVHCYYGYTATGGPEGVGRAAGRALRTSIVFIAFTDVVLSIGIWGMSPQLPGLST